jgi:hypothetical protein
MGSTISIIVMNQSLYTTLMNREKFEVKCYKCDESINVGDKCVSKRSIQQPRGGIAKALRNGERYRIYCIKCADELNII